MQQEPAGPHRDRVECSTTRTCKSLFYPFIVFPHHKCLHQLSDVANVPRYLHLCDENHGKTKQVSFQSSTTRQFNSLQRTWPQVTHPCWPDRGRCIDLQPAMVYIRKSHGWLTQLLDASFESPAVHEHRPELVRRLLSFVLPSATGWHAFLIANFGSTTPGKFIDIGQAWGFRANITSSPFNFGHPLRYA